MNRAYSLLTDTFNLFPSNEKRDFSKTYIFACQHILRPRERMFSLLVDFGIPKENIFVLGKAYSTNEKLLAELIRDGFNVCQPPFDSCRSFDEQHRENCHSIFNNFKEIVSGTSRVVVVDDGAMLLSIFNGQFADIPADIEIVGIEQTSSGFRKLQNETLHFPIINVARSATKLTKESPYIAENCLQKLAAYISEKKIRDVRFLIIGLGPIGQALFEILKTKHEQVFGFDTLLVHTNLIETIRELRPNVIVGATGTSVVTENDIEYLNKLGYPIYLVSVSSSDREFPVTTFRSGDVPIHSDVSYDNIIFVNNGFPINFEGNRLTEGIAEIERTICLLLGSVLYLANVQKPLDLQKGFNSVPQYIQDIL